MTVQIICVSRNTHRQSKLMHQFQDMIRVAVLEARPDQPTDAQELLYAFIALVTDCPIPRLGARRWCLDRTRHLAFWSRINGVQSYLCEDGSVFSFDYDARSVWAKPVGS